jgi:hypothetical protein
VFESAADAMPASPAERLRRVLLPHEPHACGRAAFELMLCLAHCGLGDQTLRIWAKRLFQVTKQSDAKVMVAGVMVAGVILTSGHHHIG